MSKYASPREGLYRLHPQHVPEKWAAPNKEARYGVRLILKSEGDDGYVQIVPAPPRDGQTDPEYNIIDPFSGSLFIEGEYNKMETVGGYDGTTTDSRWKFERVGTNACFIQHTGNFSFDAEDVLSCMRPKDGESDENLVIMTTEWRASANENPSFQWKLISKDGTDEFAYKEGQAATATGQTGTTMTGKGGTCKTCGTYVCPDCGNTIHSPVPAQTSSATAQEPVGSSTSAPPAASETAPTQSTTSAQPTTSKTAPTQSTTSAQPTTSDTVPAQSITTAPTVASGTAPTQSTTSAQPAASVTAPTQSTTTAQPATSGTAPIQSTPSSTAPVQTPATGGQATAPTGGVGTSHDSSRGGESGQSGPGIIGFVKGQIAKVTDGHGDQDHDHGRDFGHDGHDRDSGHDDHGRGQPNIPTPSRGGFTGGGQSNNPAPSRGGFTGGGRR